MGHVGVMFCTDFGKQKVAKHHNNNKATHFRRPLCVLRTRKMFKVFHPSVRLGARKGHYESYPQV